MISGADIAMSSRAEEYPRPSSATGPGGIMSDGGPRPPQSSRDLTSAESLRRLALVPFGRIVFSRYASPTIRPVNHLVDGETIVVHTNRSAALSAERQVVAYEADRIDERTRRGWCVIVTGTTEMIADPAEAQRYRDRLRPWLPGPGDHIVRIVPDMITGLEFIDPDDPVS
jgi:hypothetical protein